MTLYHASNVEEKTPMLVESNRLLDFGPGFYTTTNREQAIRFARSVVAKRGGFPMLNIYEFDESHKGTDNLKLNLKYCINAIVSLVEFSKNL